MPADAKPVPLDFAGHYPGRTGIDAYGNGGFRFAGMSHRGSLLCLPDGIHGWGLRDSSELTLANLLPVLVKLSAPQFLLLGTGRTQVFPPLDVRQAFAARLVGLEIMDTGAAARTYNVLLAEQRPVSAALLAVD
jgi:uncharacterized protein